MVVEVICYWEMTSFMALDGVASFLQEVFHVYLNNFENAVTHLFLVILGKN